MGSFKGDGDYAPQDDYRLIIQHTCTISSIFIHIDELSEKIAEVAPEFGKYTNTNVPVSAGEILGTYTGSIDYNVVDDEVLLTGFVLPESYTNEEWKIHVKDPFDYFNEPLKSQLISKSLRTAEPKGGFIDYDVDGRLIGTWFKENTNKYAGLELERYWADHLSIVHNSIDPEHVIVSIGTFKGKGDQFGVKGNAPDPAEVSVETGLVKYELVDFDYYDGDQSWDRASLVKGLKVRNGEYVSGVALFQLLEDRKLKVEIFPDKTADEVAGFTENSKIYER